MLRLTRLDRRVLEEVPFDQGRRVGEIAARVFGAQAWECVSCHTVEYVHHYLGGRRRWLLKRPELCAPCCHASGYTLRVRTNLPILLATEQEVRDTRMILRGLESAAGLVTQAGGWWRRTSSPESSSAPPAQVEALI